MERVSHLQQSSGAITHPQLPFNEAAVQAIGRLFGVEPRLAAFTHPAGPVWTLTIPAKADWRPVTMTLWPALGRVDAHTDQTTCVFTGIETVTLVTTVEAQFRRSVGGYLIVAVGGKVVARG